MFSRAIVQAEEALARCEAHYLDVLNALAEIPDLAADGTRRVQVLRGVARSWTDFLMSSGRFFSKLEQGAKSDGKSQAWHGRIKNLRKRNDVLRYIHHARNSDEHGIEPINEIKGPMAVVPPGMTVTVVRLSENEFRITSQDGSEIKFLPPGCRAVRVKDSIFNDSFEPPDFGDVNDETRKNVERLMEASLPLMYDILEQSRLLPAY